MTRLLKLAVAMALVLALASLTLLQDGQYAHAQGKPKVGKPLPKPKGKPDPQIARALAALRNAETQLRTALKNEFDEPGMRLEKKVINELEGSLEDTRRAIARCQKALKMDKRP